jgi:hypothetical protein
METGGLAPCVALCGAKTVESSTPLKSTRLWFWLMRFSFLWALLRRRTLRFILIVAFLCWLFNYFASQKSRTPGAAFEINPKPFSHDTKDKSKTEEYEDRADEEESSRAAQRTKHKNNSHRVMLKHGLAGHHFKDNGLLEVNPEGRHPIFDLISRAEKAWEEKLSRQSRTLAEAIDEYRKRYQREPPIGFDNW